MTGDLKLGLYSRAKVNYIAMPPLAKVSKKADAFRISCYLMSQILYYTTFSSSKCLEVHMYVLIKNKEHVFFLVGKWIVIL